jgi:hypothetical protein
MKRGAGDDLLDSVDDGDTDDGDREYDDLLDDLDEADEVPDVATDDEEIPYLLRRNRVKEGRETVGFGLQKETRDLENEVLREMKADLDVEKLPATDLREAAYLAGLQNHEQIKEILLEWGYEHRL